MKSTFEIEAGKKGAEMVEGNVRHTSLVSVCHIASGDLWGGAEVQIAALLKALQRKPGIGVSAILMNEGRLAQELRESGVQSWVVPERELSFRQVYSRSLEILKFRKIDVLHSHRYKENLLALLLSRRLNVKQLVRTQHGRPEPWPGMRGYKNRIFYFADGILGRLSAGRVISVSSDMRHYLRKYFTKEQITPISNGIDLEQVQSPFDAATAKRRLNIPAESPVVGTASRLQYIKRLDLFLAAARLMLRELPEIMFVIAGQGPEEARLRQLVQGTELQGRVVFLGHRNDTCDVLRAMDVLMISSDHEGMPMVLLEAMALGVPVVARNVGGIPEVICDREDGILVDSGDERQLAQGCLDVLKDAELRMRITEAARQKVASLYSADQNAELVAQMYRALTQEKGIEC